MKNLIEWIKTNPLVTASAVVSALGIGVIVYFFLIAAPSYSEEKSTTLKEQMDRQNMLMRVSVPLPNKDPNAPADLETVVINQVVINEVGAIYQKIQQHYNDILVSAKSKNAQHHADVLLGGEVIWPDADPTQFFDTYFEAKEEYKNHFKALFDVRSPGNKWKMPVMAASSPPTNAQLESLLAQSAFEYISSVGAQSASGLSQSQAEQLFAEQRMTLMAALNNRARQINLYVNLPPEEDPFAPAEEADAASSTPTTQPDFVIGAPSPGTPTSNNAQAAQYPFLIEPWAYADQPPTPDQLWEGQVQIWVTRDIMIAIARMNNVGGKVQVAGPDGVMREEDACVINSPIKRLLELKTLSGYVGIHNTGAAHGDGSGQNLFASSAAPSASASPDPLGSGSLTGGSATPSIYPATSPELVPLLSPKPVTERAAEHFGISPTGRISNATFDVRHSRLTLDIESAKLPAFMEELRKTNFMTVIKSEVTDLDEYELLREGYVYGYEDVVRVTLIVESLWFRNWTEELMPKIVKEKLLILQPEADLQQNQQY